MAVAPTGEEEHYGKQNSVREALIGNIAGAAGFLETASRLGVGFGGFARAPRFVEFRHKRVRISVRIFKRAISSPLTTSPILLQSDDRPGQRRDDQ